MVRAEAPLFPERRLIARVTRSERVGNPPYGRTSFEFDCIDASLGEAGIEEALENPDILKPFAAVRVVTTEKVFLRRYGFVPKDGAWVDLEIRPRGAERGPIAFHAQLQADGYTVHSRGALGEARLVAEPDEPPKILSPLSASVPAAVALAGPVIAACGFPSGALVSRRRVQRLLASIVGIDRIRVRDVGQASFVSLLSKNGQCIAHFDAGWPISFNGKTCPKGVPKTAGKAPVLLSHWDWDHLHAYYKCKSLREVPWLVPVQRLGPGATKIALQLHKARLLRGYSGPSVSGPQCTLIACSGSSPMNDTGFALQLNLPSGRRALMVGDASYRAMGRYRARIRYDYLVVTHHGAAFDGRAVLARSSQGQAVVSVGKGNVYKHPRAEALRKHKGWHFEFTSSHGRKPRGDRILGP